MLIEIWPDDNSTGYMLVDDNIKGIIDRAVNPRQPAIRNYFIFLKSGATIRVNKLNYDIIEEHLDKLSDSWDSVDNPIMHDKQK